MLPLPRRPFAALLLTIAAQADALCNIDQHVTLELVDSDGGSCDTGEACTTKGTCEDCATGTYRNVQDDPDMGSGTACEVVVCKVNQGTTANKCVDCPAGEELPLDAASPLDTSTASKACDAITCGADQYVIDNKCVACPAGTTQPAGGSLATADNGEVGGVGSASGANGGTCEPKECLVNQHVVDNKCVDCPAGTKHFADHTGVGASRTGINANPVVDGVATVKGTTGPEGYASECPHWVCNPNQFVNDALECVDCAAGSDPKNALDDATHGPTTCTTEVCKKDHYATGFMDGCPCDPSPNVCEPCAVGTEHPGGGLATDVNAQTCTPIICVVDQYAMNNKCVDCPTGTFAVAGADAEATSPGGDGGVETEPAAATPDVNKCYPKECKVDEEVVDNLCVPCPKGTKHAASTRHAQPLTATSLGQTDGTPSGKCPAIICGLNEYVEDRECKKCPGGTERAQLDDATAGNTECAATMCALKDEYVADHVCKPCATGSSRNVQDDASGANTECVVEVCKRSQRVLDNKCEDCPGGMDRRAGDKATGGNTQCTEICTTDRNCAAGQICVNDEGHHYCEAKLCALDEFVKGNGCIGCPVGEGREAGSDASGADTSSPPCNAKKCGVHEHVKGNKCEPCKAGTTNVAGGDDQSGDDTDTCAPTLCAEGWYVATHLCAKCDDGSTNAAGDDASGDNTVCDVTKCEENHHVEDNECEECADGMTRPAGDPATGDDTDCAKTMCGEREHVASHECKACPGGQTSDGGHDASGDDTVCTALCAPTVPCTRTGETCNSVTNMCEVLGEAPVTAAPITAAPVTAAPVTTAPATAAPVKAPPTCNGKPDKAACALSLATCPEFKASCPAKCNSCEVTEPPTEATTEAPVLWGQQACAAKKGGCKCKRAGKAVVVENQAACQQKAMEDKAHYYAFLAKKMKCVVSNSCTEKSTGGPWAIFRSGSAPTPPPTTPPCFEAGKSIPGCRAGPGHKNIASAADCQAICQKITECMFWTYVPPRGQNGGKCFPKTCQKKVAGGKKISGPRSCA